MNFEYEELGNLSKGEHFQIRKGGKWYTVHCHVMSLQSNEDSCDKYTIAYSNGKLFVFDTNKAVIIEDN